jgi:hypothetical protein
MFFPLLKGNHTVTWLLRQLLSCGCQPLYCITLWFGDIFITLKVLSSEMDPAEIRLILKVFIKGRGAEIFS